ncbi:MAG: SH3 domain-containing protein [Bdellovibrionota bacterium]
MRFTLIFPLVFTVAALWTGAAFAQTPDELFSSGVATFQKKDLKSARASFEAALKLDPSHVVTLFDLGLIESQEGHNGRAIALWRKALALAPEFRPAREAIEYARTKLERAEISHEVETWEQLRETALANTVLEKYLGIAVVLFFLSAWLLLGFFGARRRALLDEKPLPGFPVVATLFASAWVVFSGLAIAKAIDMQELRGTVVTKKIEARSTPDQAGTPLFDLYEGLEVIVRQTSGDWFQVTYPGGSTGWVPRSSVFTTADQAVQ